MGRRSKGGRKASGVADLREQLDHRTRALEDALQQQSATSEVPSGSVLHRQSSCEDFARKPHASSTRGCSTCCVSLLRGPPPPRAQAISMRRRGRLRIVAYQRNFRGHHGGCG